MTEVRKRKTDPLALIFLLVLVNIISIVQTSAHALSREPLESNRTITSTGRESGGFPARLNDSINLSTNEDIDGEKNVAAAVPNDTFRVKRAIPKTKRYATTRGKSLRGRSSKSKKAKEGFGIHLSADSRTEGTFTPDDGPYRFWNVETPPNRVLTYDIDTGKVTIHRTGLYLFYSQVLSFGDSIRRSYGIYVNDVKEPMFECLTFGRLSIIKAYRQCQLTGARHMRAGDTVYLKATEPTYSIVTRPQLTYWGIAKL